MYFAFLVCYCLYFVFTRSAFVRMHKRLVSEVKDLHFAQECTSFVMLCIVCAPVVTETILVTAVTLYMHKVENDHGNQERADST